MKIEKEVIERIYKSLLKGKYDFFKRIGLVGIPDLTKELELRGYKKEDIHETLREMYYFSEISLELAGRKDERNLIVDGKEYEYMKFKNYQEE